MFEHKPKSKLCFTLTKAKGVQVVHEARQVVLEDVQVVPEPTCTISDHVVPKRAHRGGDGGQ